MKRPLLRDIRGAMNIIRLWIILLAPLVLCPTVSTAADFGPARRLAESEILRGSFVEERAVKGLSRPVRSEGRFVVAPGYGVIWAVQKPLPVTFVFNDSGMVQTVGNIPVLQQTAAKNPFLARVTGLLSAALGGNWKMLETEFDIKKSGPGKNWRVKITQKPGGNSKMPFRAITASGKTYVERAEVLRNDGLSDTYVFAAHSITPGPPAGAEAALLSLSPQ